MRSRTLALAGVTAAALAAATAFAGTASAHGVTGSAVAHHAVTATKASPAKKGTCYTNNDPSGDSGVGIASENDSDDSGINSQGAVDFSVKKKCVIGTVTTTGVYYNGSGPANSVNVVVYQSKKGEPAKAVATVKNLKYTDSTGLGSLSVKLGKKAVSLKKGSYFLTVAANMTLSAGGQWGWELTNTTVGNADQWENQGGEFGVCPTWDDVLTCTGYGNDFMVTFGK